MAPAKTVTEKKKKKKTAEELAAEAALAAEQKAREAEEAAQKLRKLWADESEFSAKNAAKLESRWLAVFRQAKTQQLREEVALLATDSDHKFERTEALVTVVAEELKEADTARAELEASHTECISKIIKLQEERINNHHEAFVAQLQDLKDSFEREESTAIDQHQEYLQELNDIKTAMERHHSALLRSAIDRFEGMREASKGKSGEEYNVLKAAMQSKIEEREKALAECHEEHLKTVSTRSETISVMAADAARSAEEIDVRTNKLSALADSITALRHSLGSKTKDWEERSLGLTTEKARLGAMNTSLRNAARSLHSRQQARLKRLCLARAEQEEVIEAQLGLKMRVLKLASMCTKLEGNLPASPISPKAARVQGSEASSLQKTSLGITQVPRPLLGIASNVHEPSDAAGEYITDLAACLEMIQRHSQKVQKEVSELLKLKGVGMQARQKTLNITTRVGDSEKCPVKAVWGAGFVSVRS